MRILKLPSGVVCIDDATEELIWAVEDGLAPIYQIKRLIGKTLGADFNDIVDALHGGKDAV